MPSISNWHGIFFYKFCVKIAVMHVMRKLSWWNKEFLIWCFGVTLLSAIGLVFVSHKCCVSPPQNQLLCPVLIKQAAFDLIFFCKHLISLSETLFYIMWFLMLHVRRIVSWVVFIFPDILQKFVHHFFFTFLFTVRYNFISFTWFYNKVLLTGSMFSVTCDIIS